MTPPILIRYCCKRRSFATTMIAILFLLNFYFILSLLRFEPRSSQAHKIQEITFFQSSNSSLFKPQRNLNADQMMLGPNFPQVYIDDHSKLKKLSFQKFSNKCEILQPEGFSDLDWKIETPFKIYIYDLPAALNSFLSHCITKYKSASCFRGDYCGFGPIERSEIGITTHGTWQFNLEVILHHVLLHSPYRTHDAKKAQVFYVPYYAAYACFCLHHNDTLLKSNIKMFQMFLYQSLYHKAGKPHLTTIGKIEYEHIDRTCPLLSSLNSTLFRIIGIEEMDRRRLGSRSKYTKPLIVAPYPSYGHLDNRINPTQNLFKKTIANRDRTVYILLSAGRKSHPTRRTVIDNILSRPNTYQTRLNFTEFLFSQSEKDSNFTSYIKQHHGMIEAVWLTTTPECQGNHHRHTLDWMQRAIFCLQPPGDSPTRKSFYDAIISGCIPVLFTKKDHHTKYPFEHFIDYQKFTVSIPEEVVTHQDILIATYLGTLSPSKIKEMQVAMAVESQFLQYSYPIIKGSPHQDAAKYIMEEVASVLQTGW